MNFNLNLVSADNPWHWVVAILLILYIAVCFGKIAEKNGRNGIIYGILSIISPINLILLGIWAFKKKKNG